MVSIIILFSNCKQKNTNQIDGKYYLLGMAKTDTSSKACLPIEGQGYMPSADSIIYLFSKDSVVAFIPGMKNDTLLAGTYFEKNHKLTIRYFDIKNSMKDTLHANFVFGEDTLKIMIKKDKLVLLMKKL